MPRSGLPNWKIPPWKIPEAVIRNYFSGAIFSGPPVDDYIYLTYDDGPHPEVTPEILKLLEHFQARATFFVVWSEAAWWPELICQMAEAGHRIALHAIQHRSQFWRPSKVLYSELADLTQKIISAGVQPLPLYRPPFGHVRPGQVKYLRNRGIQTVLWSRALGDYRPRDPQELFDRVKPHLQPGHILDLHDGTHLCPAPAVGLTRLLLDYFQQKGWCSEALPPDMWKRN